MSALTGHPEASVTRWERTRAASNSKEQEILRRGLTRESISRQYCALEEDGIDSRCDFLKMKIPPDSRETIANRVYQTETPLRWTIKEEHPVV